MLALEGAVLDGKGEPVGSPFYLRFIFGQSRPLLAGRLERVQCPLHRWMYFTDAASCPEMNTGKTVWFVIKLPVMSYAFLPRRLLTCPMLAKSSSLVQLVNHTSPVRASGCLQWSEIVVMSTSKVG
jgi:hypothetical protein